MDRCNAQSYDARKPISSTYGLGLREVFATPHDPLPRKLEELLAQLQKAETERLNVNISPPRTEISDDARGLLKTGGRVPIHGEIFQGQREQAYLAPYGGQMD